MVRFLPCLYAFLACIGFCFVFQVRKPLFILMCSLNSALSWAVFLLTDGLDEVSRYLLATIAVAAAAEIMARLLKAPATIFLVIGIIPLVPGGGLYYTMEALINGDVTLFLRKGLETTAYAGAIAVGVSMVSSLARMLSRRGLPHRL